jgi:hypothetical protein
MKLIQIVLGVFTLMTSTFATDLGCLKLTRDLKMNEFVDWKFPVCFDSAFYVQSYEKLKNQNHCSLVPFEREFKYPLTLLDNSFNMSFKYTINGNINFVFFNYSYRSLSKTGKVLTVDEMMADSYEREALIAINVENVQNKTENLSILSGCYVFNEHCRGKMRISNTNKYRFRTGVIYLMESRKEPINYEEIVRKVNHKSYGENFQRSLQAFYFCKDIRDFLEDCTDFHGKTDLILEWFLKVLAGIVIFLFFSVFGFIVRKHFG